MREPTLSLLDLYIIFLSVVSAISVAADFVAGGVGDLSVIFLCILVPLMLVRIAQLFLAR